MPSNTEPVPLVSVIIPCRNSERTISRCLEAILNQRTSVTYDVTVVDSSTDTTPSIVESEFPQVKLIHLATRTFAGAARNIGVRATQSTYCLMLDSDCIAEPDLIERAINRHKESDYAAVGGSLANGTPRSFSGWIGYLIEFKEFMPTTPLRMEKGIPTANIVYRREVLQRFGGYDDDMWLAEDILLHWKMYQVGEQILFDPAIKVTHLNKTGWRQVLGYQVDLGRLSAVARRRGGLPGGFLLKYPLLVLLMPFARTWRAFVWFAKHDHSVLLLFLLIWPMYLLAATFWSFGFLSESWKGKAQTV
ncbi:MAG TPA: glycosyltransferase [Pyrinomonadaceae bacterium]|nr:glycosyltransferase [Pyrinomonadaceae bacterium]